MTCRYCNEPFSVNSRTAEEMKFQLENYGIIFESEYNGIICQHMIRYHLDEILNSLTNVGYEFGLLDTSEVVGARGHMYAIYNPEITTHRKVRNAIIEYFSR